MKNANSVRCILVLYFTMFAVKTLYYLIAAIFEIFGLRQQIDSEFEEITRQITYIIDIGLACIYFSFLFRMKLVQVQLNIANYEPNEILRKVNQIVAWLRFGVILVISAGIIYTVFFTVLNYSGTYDYSIKVKLYASMFSISVLLPYDACQIYL